MFNKIVTSVYEFIRNQIFMIQKTTFFKIVYSTAAISLAFIIYCIVKN